MQIKINNRELKEVDRFKCLGSMLTRDGYCTREILKTLARRAIAIYVVDEDFVVHN